MPGDLVTPFDLERPCSEQTGGPSCHTLWLYMLLNSFNWTICELLCVLEKKKKKKENIKHTTAGIRWWSPTQLLASRRVA